MNFTVETLFEQIRLKKSFLCVGLDSEIEKLPKHLMDTKHPVFEFNKAIIDATHSYAVAYKPNLGFYLSRGSEGMRDLELTVEYLVNNYPDIFRILDMKSGDIDNTAKEYAKAAFDHMDFHAATLAPYMGEDSVKPFLSFPGKIGILLALTSNKSAEDFQYWESNGQKLFHKIVRKSQTWENNDRLMYVVGATKRPEEFKIMRHIAPHSFYLVPGYGAQGGELEAVCEYGMNDHCGLLVNSSRGIIFASNGVDFAQRGREEAEKARNQMAAILEKKELL